ncbi:hypothetical protein K1T71_013130 [Dendrolimus kikuchii]|uniref:Uncharacterized protein n=1 Tax=Dendrolimus kikuchii TaxID=765133 RepID=A0ACC1CJ71_9NEOP|nr:hypothetical protein K1T71_013130 [Dendrolimus kikuchii]
MKLAVAAIILLLTTSCMGSAVVPPTSVYESCCSYCGVEPYYCSESSVLIDRLCVLQCLGLEATVGVGSCVTVL